METMKEYIDQAEKDLLHTYNRYQVVLDCGDGVYLYDMEGKKYLDFCAGIAVFALGYHNEKYNAALKEQIDKLIHTSNYYYNVPAISAAKKLKKVSGMDRVFFTNSGAEAVEGAIKAARKYAYLKDGRTDHEIIAMEHSFHGRTMGALSVTGNPKYREAFEPMIGNIKFAALNDFESVLSKVTDKTCAILFETVQGEGGIFPAEEAFMKQVKELCRERDILLILDAVSYTHLRAHETKANKAGHHDHGKGTGLRRARGRFSDDGKGGAAFPYKRGSRNHLWRKSSGMCGH